MCNKVVKAGWVWKGGKGWLCVCGKVVKAGCVCSKVITAGYVCVVR